MKKILMFMCLLPHLLIAQVRYYDTDPYKMQETVTAWKVRSVNAENELKTLTDQLKITKADLNKAKAALEKLKEESKKKANQYRALQNKYIKSDQAYKALREAQINDSLEYTRNLKEAAAAFNNSQELYTSTEDEFKKETKKLEDRIAYYKKVIKEYEMATSIAIVAIEYVKHDNNSLTFSFKPMIKSNTQFDPKNISNNAIEIEYTVRRKVKMGDDNDKVALHSESDSTQTK